jgi:hypothetical protein
MLRGVPDPAEGGAVRSRSTLALALLVTPALSAVAAEAPAAYLRDRGPGIAVSMFGTYVGRGELLAYPFFEYYRDDDAEYSPDDFGVPLDKDFRGKYRATEELVFVGFGVTERLAVELEAAVIQASLERAAEDTSGTPDRIEESGLGDVEGQVRWRWAVETYDRPEVFSYFEVVFPTQDEGSLIGTTDWELKLGSGVARGWSFATMTARLAVEYDRGEDKVDLGEAAVECLRRLSAAWSVYGAVEGTQDEVELVVEAQRHWSRRVTLKLNSAFGVTSKATDWAPEVGLLFRL